MIHPHTTSQNTLSTSPAIHLVTGGNTNNKGAGGRDMAMKWSATPLLTTSYDSNGDALAAGGGGKGGGEAGLGSIVPTMAMAAVKISLMVSPIAVAWALLYSPL